MLMSAERNGVSGLGAMMPSSTKAVYVVGVGAYSRSKARFGAVTSQEAVLATAPGCSGLGVT